MAHIFADRVRETSTTTGTGALTLAGAVSGYQTFSSAIGNTNTCHYAIHHLTANEWEVGLGTIATSGPTITRTTVFKSSNSDSAVDFSAGTKDVFVTYPADKTVTSDGTQTLTNKTIDASQLSGTVANARLDAQLQDVAGLAVTNGNFIVGDGSNFVAETGATARTSLGLGTAAVLDTGISNTNVAKFTTGVADDDFLKVDGTSIEGRSASEVLSDIGGQASLTFGISNTNAVKIDSSSVADDEYARFTADGLESRSTSEVLSDIGGQASLTFGISNTNAVKIDSASVADDEYARFTANGLESREASEVRGDIGLGTAAVLDTGISNTNVAKFTSGVADDDFLRVDGTSIEGRSASEVLSDIGAQASDAQLTDVAGLAVTDGNFIVGNGSNFVAESGATARTSLGLGTSATLDTGISNTNVAKFTSGVADDDFLRVDGTSIEGRSASQVLTDIGGQAHKNLLINGGQDVWQRSTSVTGKTSGGYYTTDRWGVDIASHGTYTIARSTDVPANSGFSYSTKIDCTTADTSLAANAQVDFYQVIEAQNLLRIKGGQSTPDQLTLSFWVKSNLTGTATAELIASDASLQLSKTFTISSANTWEKKELTYAGLTGAVTPDNGVGMYVIIWLAAGSNFTSGTLNSSTWASVGNTTNRVSSSNINIASSTSDEILFTGLQLEQGSSATDFEFEPYDVTLHKCQRYFYKYQAESAHPRFYMGMCTSNDDASFPVQFNPQMRAVPSLSSGGTLGVLDSDDTAENLDSLTINSVMASASGVTIQADVTGTALTAGNSTMLLGQNDASSYIAFDAEL